MTKAPSFLHLRSPGCSAILELDPGGAPLWRYWGPRLDADAAAIPPLRSVRPTPSFSLDHDQPLTILPTFGVGWFEQSGLLAHREGRRFEQAFTDVDVEWIVPETALVLTLRDPLSRIEVVTGLTLRDDVLVLSNRLTNLGASPLDVQWLASGVVPLPCDATAVRSYGGRHVSEFVLQVDPLHPGIWRRENRRGLTSHDNFPGAVVTTPGTTARQGVAFGAQLAWSGNHAQSIEGLDDGRFQWQMGVWLAPGEGLLAAGESLVAPEMVATCSLFGLDGVAANFHREARARMTWPGGAMRPRPVSFNTWEGNYFDHRLEDLKAQADVAAGLGVERFVLDDGWFHGRDDDRSGLGDWWPDAGKYPDGLAPLIDHVRGLGMEFGLWVEPEMINPDSDLHRAHVDWPLQVAGRPMITARNQLVLDLSRPEVTDYLFDKIDRLLRHHPIDYLKWDHNRDLTLAGSIGGRPAYKAQVEAAYGLFDRIRAAHPGVEIEACAGGGGRIDMGILSRTHRFWTSDNIDARSRVVIQRGFLQFFPPEVMGAHVGASPAHTTGRGQSLSFRAAVALPGHFGIELNPGSLTREECAELKLWIDLYKSSRALLHDGAVWMGDESDGLFWQAHGDADAGELLLFVIRLDPQTRRRASPIRLPMVDRTSDYEVELIHREGPVDTISGAWLADAGLYVDPMHAEDSRIYRLTRST